MFPAAGLEVCKLEVHAERLALPPPGVGDEPDRACLLRALLDRHPELGERSAGDVVGAVIDSPEFRDPFAGLRELAKRFIRPDSGYPRLAGDIELRHVRRMTDEDLLLAQWAESRRESELFQLSWLTTDLIQPDLPEDLATLLEGPLAETHVHLWGAAPLISIWLPAMLELVSLHELAVVAAQADLEETGGYGSRRALVDAWVCRLLEAALLRLWLAAALKDWEQQPDFAFQRISGLPPVAEIQMPARSNLPALSHCLRRYLKRVGYVTGTRHRRPPLEGCRIWVDPRHEIPYYDPLAQAVELTVDFTRSTECLPLGERFLLASGLRFLHRAEHDPRQAGEASIFRQRLLRYVRLKGAFLRIFLHHPGTRGLERFLRQFQRRGPAPDPLEQRAREVWKLALERYQTRLVVLCWLQSTSRQAALSVLPAVSPARGAVLNAQLFQQQKLAELQRKLELRISPDLGPRLRHFIPARLLGLRDALRRYGEIAPSPAHEPSRALPNLQVGLIYHLLKRQKTSPRIYEETFHKILTLLHDRPELRPFIVGLDAAGDEISASPVRFAPAFQRALAMSQNPVLRNRHPEILIQLGRTFHVGEDFRDLLTGLRQVALAVKVLKLKPGDRLGHALALGLDPGRWYKANPRTFPHRIDHWIDLVWAFDRLQGCASDEARQAREFLESLVDVVRDLPKATDSFRSWLAEWMRWSPPQQFNGERELYQRLLPSCAETRTAAPRADELVEVAAGAPWIAMVRLLQKRVAEDLERGGVVIEANPTSNLLIARLASYCDHPVFKLHPWARGGAAPAASLKISVSTDDPGMFLTSLGEEYSSLLETALKDGCSRHEALRWLDTLRADSWTSSFIRGPVTSGRDFLRYVEGLTPERPFAAEPG